MAARKKAKSTKKPATKTTKSTKATPRRKKPTAKVLTTDERARLFKPPNDMPRLIVDIVQAWTTVGRGLRVTNRTAAQLRSALAKAERAQSREETLRAEFEKKIAPHADARMLAEHAAWEAVLDVYNAVKGSRSAPEIQKAFGFLGEYFASRGKKGRKPAPADGAAGGPKPQE